jgi:hypothetical protein
VKLSKAHFHAVVHAIPELCFEDQRLTSFAGSGADRCRTVNLRAASIESFHEKTAGTFDGIINGGIYAINFDVPKHFP